MEPALDLSEFDVLDHAISRRFPKFSIAGICGGVFLGPVHTNPFSNENGAVLLRFQICVQTHRFHPSTLQHHIRFENAFIPSVRMLK